MSATRTLQIPQTPSRLTIRIPSLIAEQVKRETQRRKALKRRNHNGDHSRMLATPPLSNASSTSSRASYSDVPIKRIRLKVTPPSQKPSTTNSGKKRKHASRRDEDADGDERMSNVDDEEDYDDDDDDDNDDEPSNKKICIAIARHKYGYVNVMDSLEDAAAPLTPPSPYPSFCPSTASTETIEETVELLSSSSSPCTPQYRPLSPSRPRIPTAVLDLLPSLLPSAQEQATHVIKPHHFAAHKNALVALLTQCPETLANIPGQTNPGRYELINFLGAGAAGLVMKALDRITKLEVAIKLIIDSGRSDTHAKWHREVGLLASLEGSRGVLKVTGMFCLPACTIPSLNDDGSEESVGGIYAIVTPFYPDCLCDLEERFRHLSKDYRDWLETSPQKPWPKDKCLPALPLSWTRAIFRQLASALADMHASGIYHGDLKDENALVSVGDRPAIPGDEEEDEDDPPIDPSTIEAVFCDLGHARFLRDTSPAIQHPIHQNCALPTCIFREPTSAASLPDLAPRDKLAQYGTPAMTPPEMYPNLALAEAWCDYQDSARKGFPISRPEGQTTYHNPLPADVWALGLMLYTMLYGSLPYHVSQVFDFSPSKPEIGGPFVPTGSAKCHVPVPEQNAKDEIVPQSVRELVEGMLATKEDERWKMSEVIACEWVKEEEDV